MQVEIDPSGLFGFFVGKPSDTLRLNTPPLDLTPLRFPI